MQILNVPKMLYRRLRTTLERRQYTPYTISAYLRKTGAQIGENCYIVQTDLGTEPYLVKIGNHVRIEQGVSFMTHDGATWGFRDQHPDLQVLGPIVIHDNCYIGHRAILTPNISIGPNSVVAPGSVVIADVPPNTMVMGIPARPYGSWEEFRANCVRRWEQQRPPGIQVELGETWWTARRYRANRARLKQHLTTLFGEQLAPR
jgi:acetyltransferase-like isoleucine patch superfamily enzyme